MVLGRAGGKASNFIGGTGWIVGLWVGGLVAALVALTLCAPPAGAQVHTGSVYGTVEEASGGVAGAKVLLVGAGYVAETESGEAGRFRFLGVPPGHYSLVVERPGFGPLDDGDGGFEVAVGAAVDVRLRLPEIFEEATEVVADGALERRVVRAESTLDRAQLESLPMSPDVWDALRQVPGVVTDRVNVGGVESNEAAVVVGPGSTLEQHSWSIDGVDVSEPVTTGTPATWFDTAMFEQVSVTTGGGDVTRGTAGVATNVVTRRASDRWRGSARFHTTDDGLQSDLGVDDGDLAAPGSWNFFQAQDGFALGNRVDTVSVFTLEAGGPLVENRLGFWGARTDQRVDRLALGGFPDETDLEITSAKIHGRFGESTTLEALVLDSDRFTVGRDVGLLRPPETAWDFGARSTIYKAEASTVVGPSLFLRGALRAVEEEIEVEAAGGTAVNSLSDLSGILRGSFLFGGSERPQRGLLVDGGYFFTSGASSHEIKGGADWSTAEDDSFSAWPGPGGVVAVASTIPTLGFPLATATVGTNVEAERDQLALYLQDTIAWERWTATFGLRYDRQDGSNGASSLAPNPLVPTLLPGVDFAGADAAFEWSSLVPRLAVTWAPRGDDTVLRAGWSRFSEELSLGDIEHTHPAGALASSPLGVAQSATFLWLDNGDLSFDPAEIGPLLALEGVDPLGVGFPNRVDPGYDTPLTDELLLGVEHRTGPWLLDVAATLRRRSDLAERERLVVDLEAGGLRRHRRDDYIVAFPLVGELPDGTPYNEPVYRLRPGLAWLGGTLLTNGDREQDYRGLSLSASRGLRGGGFLRLWAHWGDWEWKVPEGSVVDPTRTLPGDFEDGGTVLQDTTSLGAVKSGVYLSQTWSAGAQGRLRIAPERTWGFDLSVDLQARDGYPVPYFVTVPAAATQDNVEREVLVSGSADGTRLDDVVMVNARIEKPVDFGEWTAVFSLDAFNLFDESIPLQRQNELGLPVGDALLEVTQPQLLRLGVRLAWR